MEENAFLKIFLWASSLPHILVSRLLEVIGSSNMLLDIQKCLLAIDTAGHIPDKYLEALVASEDHRNALHPGIDPIAMVRAVVARVRFSRIEGASTIEQQFVRVVTNRYERTLSRKFKEQVLALSIARHRSKRQIAAAYLSIAYFGVEYHGLHALAIKHRESIEHASTDFVLSAISRLKYPEPSQTTDLWESKISRRSKYIYPRIPERAIKALKPNDDNLSCLEPRRYDNKGLNKSGLPSNLFKRPQALFVDGKMPKEAQC